MAVQASYISFILGSSAVLCLNFCAKFPPLRQTAKRKGQADAESGKVVYFK
jgi:hypothetical protein